MTLHRNLLRKPMAAPWKRCYRRSKPLDTCGGRQETVAKPPEPSVPNGASVRDVLVDEQPEGAEEPDLSTAAAEAETPS